MSRHLHIHPKVAKTLDQMKSLDNAPKIAAQRAESIIGALIKGVRPARAGRLSISRDARIRNVFKFNLGKGFRLVSIKDEKDIYILFVGSHDRCDTWLTANSKKKPHQTEVALDSYCIGTEASAYSSGPGNRTAEPDDLPGISQEDLRRVFSGLVEKTCETDIRGLTDIGGSHGK